MAEGQRFYVSGEVKTPGRYELKSRSTVLDVRQVDGAIPVVAYNGGCDAFVVMAAMRLRKRGMRMPNMLSSENFPGPATASEKAAAIFMSGSSAPPWDAQTGSQVRVFYKRP